MIIVIFKKLKTSLENLKSIVTEKSGCLQTLSESEDVEAVKLQRCHEDLKISLAAWEKVRNPLPSEINAYSLLYSDRESGRIL